MNPLEKVNRSLHKLLMTIGGVFLIAMIALTCWNIVMRPFKMGLSGVYEVMGYFGAMVITCSLAYTQSKKDHLKVDILVNSYPGFLKGITEVINDTACFLFAAIAAWQIGLKGWTFYSTGEVSESLKWHYYPFTFGAAAGFGVLALLYLADLLRAVMPKKEPRP